MQKITPFLWFNDQAEEAARLYTSLFNNSKIESIAYYSDEGMGQPGKVMSVTFTLDGEEFMALNGGPIFSFSPAVSFFVSCETQEEVDKFWNALAKDGEEGQCGWLKDKFGLSWQIVPSILGKLNSDPDPEKVNRVTQAMLKMHKLVIQELVDASGSN
jgi:predicted 3-demethylubiquinone-9 3-methyltransferase (glyoxalase superfamily)